MSDSEVTQGCILLKLLQWKLLPPTLSLARIKKLVVVVHIKRQDFSWHRPRQIIQKTCCILHVLEVLSKYERFSETLCAAIREIHDSISRILEIRPIFLDVWQESGSPATALRSFLASSRTCHMLGKRLDVEGEHFAGKFFLLYFARLVFAHEEIVLATAYAMFFQVQRLRAATFRMTDVLLLKVAFDAICCLDALRDARPPVANAPPDADLSKLSHMPAVDVDTLCRDTRSLDMALSCPPVDGADSLRPYICKPLYYALGDMVTSYCNRKGRNWIFSSRDCFLALVEHLMGTLDWPRDMPFRDYLPDAVVRRLRTEILKHTVWNQRRALLSASGLQNIKKLIRSGKYSQVRLLVQACQGKRVESTAVTKCCEEALQDIWEEIIAAAESTLGDRLSGEAVHLETREKDIEAGVGVDVDPGMGCDGDEGSGRGRLVNVVAESQGTGDAVGDVSISRKRGAEEVSGEEEVKRLRLASSIEQTGFKTIRTSPNSRGAGADSLEETGSIKKRKKKNLKKRTSCKCHISALPLVYLDCLTEFCGTARMVVTQVLELEGVKKREKVRDVLREAHRRGLCGREASELLCAALDWLLRDDARHRSELALLQSKQSKRAQRKSRKSSKSVGTAQLARRWLRQMTGKGKEGEKEGGVGSGNQRWPREVIARCCLGRKGKLMVASKIGDGCDPSRRPNESSGTEANPTPTPIPTIPLGEGEVGREGAVGVLIHSARGGNGGLSREPFCLLEARFWGKWEHPSKLEEILMTVDCISEAVPDNDMVQQLYRYQFISQLAGPNLALSICQRHLTHPLLSPSIRDLFFKRLLAFPGVVPTSPLEARVLEAMLPSLNVQNATDMEGAMEDVRSAPIKDLLFRYLSAGEAEEAQLSVTTHCTGLWPPPPAPMANSLKLPAPMARCLRKYETDYVHRTKNRHLSWQHEMGSCQLDMRLPHGHQLVVGVSTLQAAVLLQFAEAEEEGLSFGEIKARLDITPQHLRPLLHSLACGRRPVLKKRPKEHGPVNLSDAFQVHNGNWRYLRRRKLEMPLALSPDAYEHKWPCLVASKEEGKMGSARGADVKVEGRRWEGVVEGETMKSAVDAAIVSVLKKEGRLGVEVLVREVGGRVREWGEVSGEYVVARLKPLEEREYVKREGGDPPDVSYVP